MASAQDNFDYAQSAARRNPTSPVMAINDLCEVCLQMLNLDDQLAGGAVETSSGGNSVALDFQGFALNEWEYFQYDRERIRWSRRREPLGFRDMDELGWERFTEVKYCRFCCASNGIERVVTPPTLPKLSCPAIEGFLFCSRLKRLFYGEYGVCACWGNPESKLHFQIQYEWKGSRYKEGKADYVLENLAIVAHHPELEHNKADLYKFCVGAWPGVCRDWLKITNDPLDKEGPVSERNIHFMADYINDCVMNHESCRNTIPGSQFVPTRLLYLGDGSSPHPRLVGHTVIDSEWSPKTQLKYATLSYCWESSLPLRTTTDSLADHIRGIPLCDMPQVCREAIHVARKLGISYLWIDALCIIQDSAKDWETESVIMSDIFTIAAAASDSCLSKDPKKQYTGELAPLKHPVGLRGGGYCRNPKSPSYSLASHLVAGLHKSLGN